MTQTEQIKFIERYNNLWNNLRDNHNCSHYSIMDRIWSKFVETIES